MWILRQAWLPLSVVLVAGGLLGQIAVVTVAGLLVLFAGGFSRLWARFALRRVACEVTLPEVRAFEGEELEIVLRLSNDKPQPLPWIELQEEFPESLVPGGVHLAPSSAPGYVTFKRATSLGWYERVTWRYRLRCGHRGYYRIGPATVRSGDIFGVFTSAQEFRHAIGVTVYPRLYDLPDLGLPAHRPFGEERGDQRIFTDPTRVLGVRAYRAGDSLREIDWKGTARRATLISRQFEPAATRQVLVALNVDTMAHTWEGYVPVALERAISVAGSVIRHALAERYAAGLVTNGSFPDSDRPIAIQPGRGPAQLGVVLEALAAVQPLTITSLERSLAGSAAAIPRGSTIVVVAALIKPELIAEIVRLRDAGHRAVVLWVADAPPPELPARVPVHNLAPALRRITAGVVA